MKTHYSSDPNPTQIKILPNQSSLQLTLKKFNFKCLLPFQKTCIDSLQSNISCIITQPTGTGKSTIYQILSGLSDGIIFVITQKQAFLKRKLEKINDSISWGALNPELTYEQQREVLSLAEQRRLKILFITPELFLLDQISIIPDLLVFENPQEMIEKYDFSLYQGKIFRKLLICPLLNQATLKRLKEIFKIERTIPENVDLISIENPFIKEQISFDNKGTPLSYKNTFFVNCTPKKEDYIKLNKSFFFNNLKWIKEDNKNKYLVNFLKNHLNSYTLILCNNKKTSEDLSSFLQKQGIKNMKYSPNCFRNQQIFIGICGVSVDVPFKSSINYVIHYEIPSDFETYLEDIANYSENCGFIGISSDIDYFHQRNSKLSGEVEKSTIENFLANFLFEANKENCSNNFVNFAQEKDILKIISLRLNEISNELDIKSETLKRILEILQEKKVLKFMSKKIVKAAIIFKRKAEEAIAISGILKNIYFHSVNKNGRLRFFVDEIERNSKCSNEEILMELKRFLIFKYFFG